MPFRSACVILTSKSRFLFSLLFADLGVIELFDKFTSSVRFYISCSVVLFAEIFRLEQERSFTLKPFMSSC